MRSLLEARLHLVPPLRRRLVEVPFGLNVPSWIDDPDFDLDYHVRRAALPAPGTPQQLAAFAADVAGRPLDRDHPLWEMYVVEGLERGYIGFVAKLHHSLIDGVAGVEILAALFDLAPDAAFEPLQAPDDWQPERVPGEAEMLGRAVADMVQHPGQGCSRGRNPRPGLVRAVAPDARGIARSRAAAHRAPPLDEPHDHAASRVLTFVSVSLNDVKAVKNALGRDGERCRARDHHRRAARATSTAATSCPTGHSSRRSRRRCEPKTTARSATRCRRCSRRCPSTSTTRSSA